MEYALERIEDIIKKKLRTNQLLLAISVLISLSIVITNKNNVYWALYFAIIGALSLPNINNCKQDLLDYRKNKLISVTGNVLEIFPERNTENVNDSNMNWIIFLEVDGKKDFTQRICIIIQSWNNKKRFYNKNIPYKTYACSCNY